MFITPDETIGDPVTVNLVAETGARPTLVTVPPPFPLPPVELIVTFPFAWSITILVPAMILVTPVFVTVTVPVLALDVTPIPAPAVNVLYGLALLNCVVKFTFALVKAVYNESLLVGSFGNPILITCCPGMLMSNPYDSIYQ